MTDHCILEFDKFETLQSAGRSRLENLRVVRPVLKWIIARKRPQLNIADGLCLLAGKMYAVVGESGAGKTVLNSLFMGCPAFATGHIEARGSFFGAPIDSRDMTSRRNVEKCWSRVRRRGVLLYLPQLLPDGRGFEMKVSEYYRQTVRALLRQCRVKIPDGDLLKIFTDRDDGLFSVCEPLRCKLDRPVNQLSGGERRRIELIARVFALSKLPPKRQALLVLDEPTTGLDVPGVRDYLMALRECFKTTVKGHVAIVVTTHALHLLGDDKVFDAVVLVRKPDFADSKGVRCFVSQPIELEKLNREWIAPAFETEENKWSAFLKFQSRLSPTQFDENCKKYLKA